MAERAEWDRRGAAWLRLKVVVLAKSTVEVQSVFLEKEVDQEELGQRPELAVKEQVRVEAEEEEQVLVSGPPQVELDSGLETAMPLKVEMEWKVE